MSILLDKGEQKKELQIAISDFFCNFAVVRFHDPSTALVSLGNFKATYKKNRCIVQNYRFHVPSPPQCHPGND